MWYLYILEMLVQMSWSLQWWRSTRQSSDSIEKDTKSGRESGWSARFLSAAVSYRGQRSDRKSQKGKREWPACGLERFHIYTIMVCQWYAVASPQCQSYSYSSQLLASTRGHTAQRPETVWYGYKSFHHNRKTCNFQHTAAQSSWSAHFPPLTA